MTDTRITGQQFRAFVREHRGDYTGEAADIVSAFVEQIGGDRGALRLALSTQMPPYELVSGYAVATPAGEQELPNAARVTQVVPADGSCRIGHVVQTDLGWLAYHYASPTRQIGVGTEQANAVFRVFVEHFITMGRLADERG